MQELNNILKKHFKHSQFRKGQEEIILSIIENKDTLAVMPTGGGKSLCYQLPAVMLEGTAIVISPLIALMKDQVDALNRMNIPATFINSSIELAEMQERVAKSITGEYKLLYIAPERLESDFFMRILKEMKISFLAIDEAHCISEWGHDFRPAYMNIKKALQLRPIRPIAAFTATAGPEVQEDIIKSLELKGINRFIKGFDRPNLIYNTIESTNKIEKIVEILKKSKNGSSIIYCGSRKRVEEYTFQLNKLGFSVLGYHAGMETEKRKSVQDSFISDKIKIIVATNAFGMGIDKPDVRNVIHCDLTGSLEAYYQEAGRAGRDGEPSQCTLIHNSSDIELQEYFISMTHPEIDDMQKLYAALHYYSDKFNQVNLSPTEIAEKTSISQRLVASILDILERNEIIQRFSQPARAKIKIQCDRDALIDYYNNTSTERRDIIAAFMRQLSADVFNRFLDLNILDLCKKHNLQEEKVVEILRALSISNFIEFIPEQSSGTILLKHEKKLLSELPIALDLIKERKKKAKLKLGVVLRYADTSDCKRNFILDYFQDSDYSSVCGKCSSCLSTKKIKDIKSKNEFLTKGVLKGLFEINSRFGKNALIDFLIGKKGDKIKKFELDKIENFAILSDFSEHQIREAIEKCIEKRYIRVSAGLYPILSLTNDGLTFISKKIPNSFIETSELYKDELYNKLTQLRAELASREGIPHRSIASDKALRNLAISPPSNYKQFAEISGIGNFIAEKYGKLFLSVIIGEVADEFDEKPQLVIDEITWNIVNYFESRLTIDDVASKLKLDKGTIARNLQDAIMN